MWLEYRRDWDWGGTGQRVDVVDVEDQNNKADGLAVKTLEHGPEGAEFKPHRILLVDIARLPLEELQSISPVGGIGNCEVGRVLHLLPEGSSVISQSFHTQLWKL